MVVTAETDNEVMQKIEAGHKQLEVTGGGWLREVIAVVETGIELLLLGLTVSND